MRGAYFDAFATYDGCVAQWPEPPEDFGWWDSIDAMDAREESENGPAECE